MHIWTPVAAVLSLPYRVALDIRNAYYDRSQGAVYRPPVPVISVGNLTVGGTGKTPIVIEIVRLLRELGAAPAILTRGYRAPPGQEADEVREFRLALPGTPVVVDADRVRGAATAQTEYGADCVVLDDGFQHRRLARDLDLVTIDALDPWGGGWVLPAGRLRESRAGLRRADVVILTRVNQIEPVAEQQLRGEIAEVWGGMPKPGGDQLDIRKVDQAGLGHGTRGCGTRTCGTRTCEIIAAVVEVTAIVSGAGRQSPDVLRGRRVFGVCGIGNPRSFACSLAGTGANVAGVQAYRDHCVYRAHDAEWLQTAAARAGAAAVVTTRKDWVKLSPYWRGQNVDLLYLEMRLAVRDPASLLVTRLREVVERYR